MAEKDFLTEWTEFLTELTEQELKPNPALIQFIP
jgi:hypothetical protein